MAVLTDLFQLILVALTLVIVSLFVIVVLMIRDSGKSKAKTGSVTRSKVTHKCLHFVGYLAEENSKGNPIPDECLGCASAMECISKHVKKKKIPPQIVS